jgi:hypothetical protein
VFEAGCGGCSLVLALVMAGVAPSIARSEYRSVQGHWPRAVLYGRLFLISLEAGCLFILVMGIPLLRNNSGNPPLLPSTDPRWDWVVVLIGGVGSFTVLATSGLAVLTISQRLRYGLPPRIPSA